MFPKCMFKCATQTWLPQTDFFLMMSSNGNIFRVIGHLCWEFTGHRWIPHTKASDAELWCIFYLRLNKLLSKQSWGWLFDTPFRSLWCHCNVLQRPEYDTRLLSIVWLLIVLNSHMIYIMLRQYWWDYVASISVEYMFCYLAPWQLPLNVC